MPVVRLKGWQPGSRPNLPTTPLSTLLTKEAGMDGSDAEASVRRLEKGKSVDVSFDLGEDKAAEAFVRKVAAFGLIGELYHDEPSSWYGSPPRPLFLKLSVAVLAGFAIWL